MNYSIIVVQIALSTEFVAFPVCVGCRCGELRMGRADVYSRTASSSAADGANPHVGGAVDVAPAQNDRPGIRPRSRFHRWQGGAEGLAGLAVEPGKRRGRRGHAQDVARAPQRLAQSYSIED